MSSIREQIQHCWDFKTKPQGSLGRLEEVVIQLGLIFKTTKPIITKPTMLVFAGDHGIAKDGVSAFPQEVTYQMVMNFLRGGAAINVLCRENGIDLKVIDSGVIGEFPDSDSLIKLKIAEGTKSFYQQGAMDLEHCQKALDNGQALVQKLNKSGVNTILLGEMGIANTSAASCLMATLLKLPIDECVGSGTGLISDGLARKKKILGEAIARAPKLTDPKEILSYFGGFEIATMVGAILEAYEESMAIIVDGFITTSAVLVASKINPKIIENCLYSHQSQEQGHVRLLKSLDARPLLQLDMRLGEGSGAAVSFQIIKNSLALYQQMASFEDAKVSNKSS